MLSRFFLQQRIDALLTWMNSPMAETKHEKFVRLAEARTNKIIDMLRLLGNCANTNVYEYSQNEVEKIFNALESELKESKKKFQKEERAQVTRFSL